MKASEFEQWATILVPIIVGLLIAATGGWTSERWAWGLTVMGYGPVAKLKYSQGFWTVNPQLDQARAELARHERNMS